VHRLAVFEVVHATANGRILMHSISIQNLRTLRQDDFLAAVAYMLA
jgi:hypothetical protein